MSLIKFAEGVKFNFQNFLAFCILFCCFITWWKILDGDFHDSAHVSEIRTGTLAITMLICGYFYGASQNSKKKDDTIQEMLSQTGRKDETIKSMAKDAKDLVETAKETIAAAPPASVIPKDINVTINEKNKDEPGTDIPKE